MNTHYVDDIRNPDGLHKVVCRQEPLERCRMHHVIYARGDYDQSPLAQSIRRHGINAHTFRLIAHLPRAEATTVAEALVRDYQLRGISLNVR